MTQYLFFLLLGAAAGAIIAAFALGLLVTHQGSGVINFGFGATTAWSAYVYADLRHGAYPWPIPGVPGRLHLGHDVGVWWAVVFTLLTSAVLALLLYAVVFRPLAAAPDLAKVVASIGIVVAVLALIDRRFGDHTVPRSKPILPRQPMTLMHGVTVPRDGLWLALIVVVMGVAVWAASRFTRIGLATRAAASNEFGAVLLGYSPRVLAASSFLVASLVGTVVVVLAASMIQLTSGVFTFGYLVPALGAALIGRFRRIGITLGVGFAIGMVQSMFTKLQTDLSWFPKYGAREGLPFVVIIVAMAVLGERLPERGSVERLTLPPVPPARVTVASVGVPSVAALLGVFLLGPLWRGAIMTTAVAVVIALSYVVLTGFAGQVSLAQMAFAGVAGFALSKLTTSWGVPFPVAPLLAAVIAMVFGVVVGLPALRVRGSNLAIITFAGGVAIAEFVFKNPTFVGDASTGGAKVPNPTLGGWDLGLVAGTNTSRPVFAVLLVVVAVALALMVANLRRSATGRRIIAARSNERGASAAGVDVGTAKLQAYALSSFIAGVGGCLVAYRFGSVSDVSFGVVASLTTLAFAYLGGITSISGAVTAGLLASSGVVFYGMSRLNHHTGPWEAFIGGVVLVVVAITNPSGVSGGVRRLLGRRRVRSAQAGVAV